MAYRDDFYSHAPCGARCPAEVAEALKDAISTHTPLARRDFLVVLPTTNRCIFLLTRLLRGATQALVPVFTDGYISTHTSLARRDVTNNSKRKTSKNFYSHVSCEARPESASVHTMLPVISTHTPLARRDT